MKQALLPYLVCPRCLPHDEELRSTIIQEAAGDILEGQLRCGRCGSRYPIRNGIALLTIDQGLPTGEQLKYEQGGVRDRYLWTQFSDLLTGNYGNSGFHAWQSLLPSEPGTGLGLDAGCAVGRLTFSLAASHPLAVGCDLSYSFIKTARRLMHERRIDVTLPLHGTRQHTETIILPDHWHYERVEFIVADARRLPFRSQTVQTGLSLNLLDRIDYPLAHLHDVNRVLNHQKATLLVASPWSWTETASPVDRWLGGSDDEESGTVVREILTGVREKLTPAWQVLQQGDCCWKIRHHERHIEELRSQYLLAKRVT